MVESGSPFCPSALPSDGTLQEKNAPREKSSTVLLLLPLFLDPLGEEVPEHLLLVVPELAPPLLGAVRAEPLHVGPAGVGTGQERHAALQFCVEKTNELLSGVLHTGTSVSRLPPSLPVSRSAVSGSAVGIISNTARSTRACAPPPSSSARVCCPARVGV